MSIPEERELAKRVYKSVLGNNHRTLRKLLRRGASTMYRAAFSDETALHVAASRGLSGVVRQLIRHGADVNAQTKHGCTPLFNAIVATHPNIIKILIQAKANLFEPYRSSFMPDIASAALLRLCSLNLSPELVGSARELAVVNFVLALFSDADIKYRLLLCTERREIQTAVVFQALLMAELKRRCVMREAA